MPVLAPMPEAPLFVILTIDDGGSVCPRCNDAFTGWCNYHQVRYCKCAAQYHVNCP